MTRLTVAELPTSDGRPAIYIIFNVSDFLHICPYAETHRVRWPQRSSSCILTLLSQPRQSFAGPTASSCLTPDCTELEDQQSMRISYTAVQTRPWFCLFPPPAFLPLTADVLKVVTVSDLGNEASSMASLSCCRSRSGPSTLARAPRRARRHQPAMTSPQRATGWIFWSACPPAKVPTYRSTLASSTGILSFRFDLF